MSAVLERDAALVMCGASVRVLPHSLTRIMMLYMPRCHTLSPQHSLALGHRQGVQQHSTV